MLVSRLSIARMIDVRQIFVRGISSDDKTTNEKKKRKKGAREREGGREKERERVRERERERARMRERSKQLIFRIVWLAARSRIC